MAIVDSEVATLGPICDIFATSGPRHVEYNGDSIFVVVSLDALVCVCGVRGDQAVSFRGEFCWLKIFQRIGLRLRHVEIDIEHIHRCFDATVRSFATFLSLC